MLHGICLCVLVSVIAGQPCLGPPAAGLYRLNSPTACHTFFPCPRTTGTPPQHVVPSRAFPLLPRTADTAPLPFSPARASPLQACCTVDAPLLLASPALAPPRCWHFCC